LVAAKDLTYGVNPDGRVRRVCGALRIRQKIDVFDVGNKCVEHLRSTTPLSRCSTVDPLTRIFVRVDSRHPCRQWQAAAATAGVSSQDDWYCEPIECAYGDRREIIKYRVVSSDRQTSYGWIDATIGFPVRWQTADGKLFVLESILLQAQPASLFSMPADYRKLDPQAPLERIKHSDVWADSPQ
jgi:hypothetical protein